MTIESMIVHRRIAKVSDAHRAHMVIEPGHWKEADPFLLLAEDWFRPGFLMNIRVAVLKQLPW